MRGLEAGSATVEITPEEPVVMGGYGDREGVSTGVHDPLYAKCVVFFDGVETVAIVALDLLNVSRELTASVRRGLADTPITDVLLAATHTHGGPYVPARAIDASPLLRRAGDHSAVVNRIRRGAIESVRHAHDHLTPATIRVGTATNRKVVCNRRAEGGVSGDVRVPSGDTDPELTALLVEPDSGDDIVLYSYACHPVCTTGENTRLTADWPGVVADRSTENRPDTTTLFLNGATGDVNPRGYDEQRSVPETFAYAETVGTAVADTLLEAITDAESHESVSGVSLSTERVRVDFPLKSTPPRAVLRERIDDLAAERERLDADTIGRGEVTADWLYARTLLAIAEQDATRIPGEVQYLEVGDVGLVGLPGEAFVRHGLEFERAASAETLLPVGYANGYVGYLPPLATLENGGYEVRAAKVAPEAVVAFRDRVLDLVS